MEWSLFPFSLAILKTGVWIGFAISFGRSLDLSGAERFPQPLFLFATDLNV